MSRKKQPPKPPTAKARNPKPAKGEASEPKKKKKGTSPPSEAAQAEQGSKADPAPKAKKDAKVKMPTETRIRRNVSVSLRLPMKKGDMQSVLSKIEDLVVNGIYAQRANVENIEAEIKAAETRRAKLKAELREAERTIEELNVQIQEMTVARSEGKILQNVVVDQWVTNQGELFHTRAGSRIEIGDRRTATSEEVEMAASLRLGGTPEGPKAEDKPAGKGKKPGADKPREASEGEPSGAIVVEMGKPGSKQGHLALVPPADSAGQGGAAPAKPDKQTSPDDSDSFFPDDPDM